MQVFLSPRPRLTPLSFTPLGVDSILGPCSYPSFDSWVRKPEWLALSYAHWGWEETWDLNLVPFSLSRSQVREEREACPASEKDMSLEHSPTPKCVFSLMHMFPQEQEQNRETHVSTIRACNGVFPEVHA